MSIASTLTGSPDRPPTTQLALVALIYAAFVVYGSLVPLEFRYRSLQSAWSAFQHIPYLKLGVASRADWIANILLYLPLAFLAMASLAAGARTAGQTALATVVVVAACLALAFGVEFAQLFFPPRTVSRNDLIAESIGTALGVTLWLFAGPQLLALAQRLSWGGAHTWQALAALYALAYVAYGLFPFDFLISSAELQAKFNESGRTAWLLADSCGGVLGCSVKLGAEIALAAPLGALAGLAMPRLGAGAAFGMGIGLGIAIEAAQMLLASGTSQGFSVLARGAGLASSEEGSGRLIRERALDMFR